MPGRVLELGEGVAQRVGELEASHAGDGVDGREDEQGLEHDGEVVPEAHHGPASADLVEDVGDAHRQGGGAAGARDDVGLADVAGQALQGLSARVGLGVAVVVPGVPLGGGLAALGVGDTEVGHGDLGELLAVVLGVVGGLAGGRGYRLGAGELVHGRRRGVHGEVDARAQRDRGGQRHDRHEGLHEHAAVADHADLSLLLHHLGAGARGDHGVHAGQGAAGDGDEQEGEEGTGEDRAVGVEGELGDGGHLHQRAHDDDAQGQDRDGADLHEGRQVVARGEQDPHGQDRGQEAVDDHGPHQGGGGQVQVVAEGGFGHPAPADDDGDEQAEADEGDLGDLAGLDEAQPQAHPDGDRDGHTHREDSPGGGGQGVDADHGQDRQDDHEHDEDDDGRHDAADPADLVSGHLAQGAAAAAHGEEQDEHVLDGAGHEHADDDPQGAGQVAHLGGQDRADQWAGAGDGCEVVAVEDDAVSGVEVAPVVDALGRGGVGVVGAHDAPLDVESVEAVPDRVGAHGGDHEPDGVDVLAAHNRQHPPAQDAQGGDDHPGGDPCGCPSIVRTYADGDAVGVADDPLLLLR